MSSELPFKLTKYHKCNTKKSWKAMGVIFNDDEFNTIYNRYIYATNCELCNKKFKTTRNRNLEHNHQTGKFRNVVCNSCNSKKYDCKNNKNKSGYKNISKEKRKDCVNGYIWRFVVRIEGKKKQIKTSTDLEWLIEFADKWKKDNNYIT
jgi:hypothetical protein